jgi:hypothetical protein
MLSVSKRVYLFMVVCIFSNARVKVGKETNRKVVFLNFILILEHLKYFIW